MNAWHQAWGDSRTWTARLAMGLELQGWCLGLESGGVNFIRIDGWGRGLFGLTIPCFGSKMLSVEMPVCGKAMHLGKLGRMLCGEDCSATPIIGGWALLMNAGSRTREFARW